VKLPEKLQLRNHKWRYEDNIKMEVKGLIVYIMRLV